MNSYYSHTSTESIIEEILTQARSDVSYGRKALREYRRKVTRRKVERWDDYEFMGGIPYYMVMSSLESVANIAERLDTGHGELRRIAKIILRHISRFERDFKALYEQDRDQIRKVKQEYDDQRFGSINPAVTG